LDGELGSEGATGDHLVERLGEAHADGGPLVQLEGGHRLRQTSTLSSDISCKL
jgi:hypothetical protein